MATQIHRGRKALAGALERSLPGRVRDRLAGFGLDGLLAGLKTMLASQAGTNIAATLAAVAASVAVPLVPLGGGSAPRSGPVRDVPGSFSMAPVEAETARLGGTFDRAEEGVAGDVGALRPAAVTPEFRPAFPHPVPPDSVARLPAPPEDDRRLVLPVVPPPPNGDGASPEAPIPGETAAAGAVTDETGETGPSERSALQPPEQEAFAAAEPPPGASDDAPGHGATPPGHEGNPPGHQGPPGHQSNPPGHGSAPPGKGPGQSGTAPGHTGNPARESGAAAGHGGNRPEEGTGAPGIGGAGPPLGSGPSGPDGRRLASTPASTAGPRGQVVDSPAQDLATSPG